MKTTNIILEILASGIAFGTAIVAVLLGFGCIDLNQVKAVMENAQSNPATTLPVIGGLAYLAGASVNSLGYRLLSLFSEKAEDYEEVRGEVLIKAGDGLRESLSFDLMLVRLERASAIVMITFAFAAIVGTLNHKGNFLLLAGICLSAAIAILIVALLSFREYRERVRTMAGLLP